MDNGDTDRHSHKHLLLRVLDAHSPARHYRHIIKLKKQIANSAIAYCIGWGILLGLFGAAQFWFFWVCMCGLIPLLPHPLPAIINWTIILTLAVLGGYVDELRQKAT